MRDKLACAAFIWAIIAKSGGDVVFWDLLLGACAAGVGAVKDGIGWGTERIKLVRLLGKMFGAFV
jgi:hypothetical protein